MKYLPIWGFLFACQLLTQGSLANEYADIGLPVTKVFDIDEHGGGTQNWWLTQTDNGLIYVGTNRGLNEWDGEQWRFYTTPGKTRIRAIKKWTDGRLYVGTQNDIGYYQADRTGVLKYHSLLENWSIEQRQFGEVWSVAANKHGVMFAASKALLYWDGQQVSIVENTGPSIPRIFALTDRFIFKRSGDNFLTEIQLESGGAQQTPRIVKTNLFMPEKAAVRNIFLNGQQQLVVFTSTHGIYQRYDDVLEQQIPPNVLGSQTNIYNAIQSSDGYYYVVTLHDGVFILDERLQPIRQYTEQHNIGSQRLYHVMEDHQGNIWLSGRLTVTKMVPPHVYSVYQTDIRSTGSQHIGLLKNRVAVAGDGLFQLTYPTLTLAPAYFKNIKSDKAFSWHFIEYKNHLFYSAAEGVLVARITPSSQNTNIKLADTRLLIDASAGRRFVVEPITNTLFAATNNGLYRIVYDKEILDWHVGLIEQTQDELDWLAIDDEGIIWAGTAAQTLYKVAQAQYPDIPAKVEKFTADDGLAANNVIPFNLSSGMVIGTGDGLMDYQSGRHPQLDFVKGWPSIFSQKGKDVFVVYEDPQGRIWYRIGQHSGYIVKNENGQWLTREDIFSPFQNVSFKGYVSTSDNIIWFTLATGAIHRLDADALRDLPDKGTLNIRQVTLLQDGSTVYGGLNRPLLPELDQQHNALRIHYALADNTIEGTTQYRHRLLGSSHEAWTDWSFEHYRDFTELGGADYQFEVQARDGWGRTQSVTLPFIVLPPWYLSTWAWIAYGISALLLLILSGWLTQRWRTAKLVQQNAELEQQVALRTQEVQNKVTELQQQQTLKDRFFSNVSHEFRTPLTLIIEPLNEMLKTKTGLEHDIALPVETALRNSKKMLGLVGQVLDINRLESGQFPLHVAQYDIANLINHIVQQHAYWAEQHQQRIITRHTENPYMLYYDQDQIEKCISNLISNAIKYGGVNCQISVSLLTNHLDKKRKSYAGIEVCDTGPGINADAQEKVFERFYQGEQSEKITEPGTGIGLALVKEFIELHQGDIELVNTAGSGCRFILWLRQGYTHFEASQLLDAESTFSSELTQEDVKHPIEATATLPVNQQSEDITTVLVVDDNAELRQFISHRLTGYYQVIQATNGEEGLALAKSHLPDLIISDVMMPIMDGLQMTQSIKRDSETCTIPIILLTAKSTKRETVEGIQSGADDYISKPFDTSELIVRVARLISAQKILRKIILEEIAAKETYDPQANEKEPSFKDKLRAEIQAHLSQPDFDIKQLCDTFFMSRSSLNRKCQEVLNKSIGQYIIELRMQMALSLLKDGKHSVSEIAYGTGHESLAYFSRAFKKHFGQSPTMFKNQKHD